MMKYWIKQVGASWRNLVHALESPLMNEIAVAQKITNKYLGMLLIIIIIITAIDFGVSAMRVIFH